MDLKLIQSLIRMMKSGGLGELELEDPKEGFRLRLKRGDSAPPAPAASPIVHVMQAPGHAAAPPALASAAALAASLPAVPEAPVGTPIPSPMVGTFYRSPSPDAEPFLRVGGRVEVDSPLCIIEAMKVMNEIKSEVAGEVLEILVENGEPVEFGQPLFLVKLR